MYTRLVFETTRFDPFHFERRYVSDITPGGDVASWLSAHLRAHQYHPAPPQLVDGGWTVEVLSPAARRYRVGIRSDGVTIADDRSRWEITVELKRSRTERLLRRNRLGSEDPLCTFLEALFSRQYDFGNVELNR